ncbi:MAG: hypothetical protein GEU75_06280 [Dehalococcoidia bacterium]|nr:hypothetical protein [Dehalococcoidia bacterium]
MLTDRRIDEAPEGTFKRVAEAAWALQANHERFLFKKARPHDHPSRAAWVNANNLWQAQVRARRAGRVAAT